MRITDLSISKIRERREIWKERAMEAVALELDDEVVIYAISKAINEHCEIVSDSARTSTEVPVVVSSFVYGFHVEGLKGL